MNSEQIYKKKRMANDKMIILSVLFGDFGKRYYYLTDDDTIEVGNQVIVPVGDDGTERIVEVVKKEYLDTDTVFLPPEQAGLPVQKVKRIIGKFDYPELDENGEARIFCPICNREIDLDDCYEISLGECLGGIPGLITHRQYLEKKEICDRCRYHE